MKQRIYVEKKFWDYIDFRILIPVILITIFGLISIYSSTAESANLSEFKNQFVSFGIALIAMLFFMFFPEKLLRYGAVPVYSIAILLLLAALAIGTKNYGTRGWIIIGGKSFQPAELAKFGVILMSGFLFTNLNVSIKHLRTLFITIFLFTLPVILILLQPDVGSATVFFAIFIGFLFWTGVDNLLLYSLLMIPILLILSLIGGWTFWVGISAFTVLTFLFKRRIYFTILVIAIGFSVSFIAPQFYNHLAPHQKARIDNFIEPGKDNKDTGYNVAQSVLAVGSGGLVGKGFMQGTQTQLRYIPMQWTDFIFSVPAEEFGFVGAAIILILYYYLLNRIIILSTFIRSRFFSIISFTAAIMFIYHIIINIGMVLGLMPVMGIPLPFMSYGGSSLIINYSLIGLILNAYKNLRNYN
jgi:rod shape determining protein RodA